MVDYNKFDFLEKIFMWDKKKVNKELSPLFYQYYRRYFNDVQRLKGMIDEAYHIVKITKAKGKKIIDLGCGYGLLLIQMRLLGSKEVVGIDFNKDKIAVFKKILTFMPQEIANLCTIYPRVGDILKINYPNDYFDVAIARETISHVRNLSVFSKEVKRVLKKNGVFFIKDGNNALDIYGRLSRRKIWKKHEFGPVGDIGLKKPYRILRKEMIKERYPDLSINKLNFLVDKTIGMWGEELYEAIDNFLNKGTLPKPPKFKFRNPKTGEYTELEFNPYHLKKLLKKIGYRSHVIRPFYSYSYAGLKGIILNTIGRIISLSHPASLFIAPTFEIIAKK